MAAKGKLSPAQIERARKLLQDLPEIDDRKSREEAAGILERDFRKALQRGYTPKQLSMMLKNAGIIIPAYLVEKYLKSENASDNLKQGRKPAQKAEPKPAPPPTPAKEPKQTVEEGEFIVTPDTPLEDL